MPSRATLQVLLDGLDGADPELGAPAFSVVHVAASPGSRRAPASPLPDELAACLPPGGLWSHQAETLDHARAGRNVVLATSSGSGRHLCVQIAAAEAAIAGGTSIVVCHSKAAAHERLRAWAATGLGDLTVVTHDGDSDQASRAVARHSASVLLTNADMLHASVLPDHGRWKAFLSRLRYVVVEDLDALGGIFGSHVSHVLRRLRRLAAHHGASPTLLAIARPTGDAAGLASALWGEETLVVDSDGTAREERSVAVCNPPLVDAGAGRRRSAHRCTADLVAAAARQGIGTVVVCRTRAATELVASRARRSLPAGFAERIVPLRGGYLPGERRAIQRSLLRGEVTALVTTAALVPDLDLSGMPLCVLDGFPGTVGAVRDHAAARELVVVVAGPDALDQWISTHPAELVERPAERVVANPANRHVLGPQLACAAWELPLAPDDDTWWSGPPLADGDFEAAVTELVGAGRLALRNGHAVPVGSQRPAWSLRLRALSGRECRIVGPEGQLIGTVPWERTCTALHPGAVYLHQGQCWRVEELDLESGVALVEPAGDDELTQPRTEVKVRLGEHEHRSGLAGVNLGLGPAEVVERVVGYRRRDAETGETRGEARCELPATVLETRAVWWSPTAAALDRAGFGPGQGEGLAGALHAVEHAIIGMLPLFAVCDRADVGGFSLRRIEEAGDPAVVVYDGYQGGAGIAELAFSAAGRLLEATLENIAACPCERGCPACVQSPRCGTLNEPLDKAGAQRLLLAFLDPTD